MKQTILIIEDDRALNTGVALSLRGPELEPLQAYSLAGGRPLLSAGTALLILDINLPDGSGLDFCREVKDGYGIPVILLTANDLESDVVAGLELGADDYITKPFSLAILRARVNAVLRRHRTPGVKTVGNLLLDFDGMRFLKDGAELELSRTEQKLLRILAEHPGRPLARETLINRVWSDGAEFVDENALSVTVRRLRAKIEDDPRQPRHIKTIFGIGYQWEIE